MKSILITDIKIALALALFYVVYRLVLGNDTFFVRNRFYLLVAMFVSFVSPWLRFETKVYAVMPALSEVPANAAFQFEQPKEASLWPVFLEVLMWVYILGVLLYLMRFVWAYKKIIGLIVNSEKKKFQDLILVITRLSIAPFSVLKWLVIPSHQISHPGFENIVQHESIHCRQYHSVDLFLAELMVAFQWFNPFAWWLKKSMVENHEFIVDRAILKNGMDSRKYQYLLLNFSTGSHQSASVNYFNTNLLKKRIRMMNKARSPRWYGVKNSMILISLAVVVAFTATFETKIIAQNPTTKPLIVVNGKKTDKPVDSLNPEKIQQINVIKDKDIAIGKYGIEAENGVVEIMMKDTFADHKAEVKIKANDPQAITIKPDSLEEITVIGYGKNKRKKDPLILMDGKKINYNEINSYKASSLTIIERKDAVEQYGDDGENGVLVFSTKENPEKVEIRNKKVFTEPIYVVNGETVSKEAIKKINPDNIQSVIVLTDDHAINKYGFSAKDGAIEILLKDPVKVENPSLIIAPNPAFDLVNITLTGGDNVSKLQVKVYDNFGKKVYQGKKSGPTFSLSVGGMLPGNYIVNVSDGANVYKGMMVVGQ